MADAAARAARPPPLAVQVALGVRRLAGPAGRPPRAGVSASERRLPRAPAPTGSRTGSGLAGRGASPTRSASSASGARLRRYAAERGVRHDRRRRDLRGARRASTIARIRSCSSDGARRRRAAGRLLRHRPAVGQPALRLAGAAPARLPLVGRAAARGPRRCSTSPGSTTSAASSPTGRCRRDRDGGRRALEARARARAVRRGVARARASCRWWPRTSG